MPYNNVAEKWTQEPALRDRLFCELTDAAPSEGNIRFDELTGQIPCIAHYAQKTQLDILRALLQKMSSSTWSGDRLVRVHRGLYRWSLRDWRTD